MARLRLRRDDEESGGGIALPAPDPEKAAKLLTEGATIKDALLGAGYSANVARHGRAALSGPIRAALGELLGKEAEKFITLGKQFSTDDLSNLVTGRLAHNVIVGTDEGQMSAKTLGGRKDISMWQPEVQHGVVVITPPMGVSAGIVDLEE